MTIESFRELKYQMQKSFEKIEKYRESFRDSEYTIDTKMDKLLYEYLMLEIKLLENDLSNIPFEEWEGLSLYRVGTLDFSKTHANIDFSLFKELNFTFINLNGCNVKNLDLIKYHEKDFDEEFINNHQEYFLDKSISKEVRNKFYEHSLSFADLITYPDLINKVNRYSFENNNKSESRNIVKSIGLEHSLKLIEEYPFFVTNLTIEREKELEKSIFKDVYYDENRTYEESKDLLFKSVIENAENDINFNSECIKSLPLEASKNYPEVFFYDAELPKEIIDKYYNGRLSLSEIRQYYDVLKNKNLEIPTNNYKGRIIRDCFKDMKSYLETVPKQLDQFVEAYTLEFLFTKEGTIVENPKANEEPDEFVRNAIRTNVKFKNKQIDELEVLYAISKYIPMNEIFYDDVIEFINDVGFLELVEYNKKHDYIFDCYPTRIEFSLLYLFASYREFIEYGKYPIEEALETIIGELRWGEGKNLSEFIKFRGKELSKVFPKHFIDYEKIEQILEENVDEFKIKNIFSLLESGINGSDKDLFTAINLYPKLIPTLEGKELITHNEVFIEMLDALGTKRYLEICSKYGNAFLKVLEVPHNSFQVLKLVDSMQYEDYEEEINQMLYEENYLFREKKLFDPRTLPESFKKQYPNVFLSDDAPEDLSNLFYSTEPIGPRQLYKHHEWIPYLLGVEMQDTNIIYTGKVLVCEEGTSLIAGYAEKTFYDVMLPFFHREDILKFLCDYGAFIEDEHPLVIDKKANGREIYIGAMNNTYNKFLNKRLMHKEFIYWDRSLVPKEFIEMYPQIFLDEKSEKNKELHDAFYGRKITPSLIREHPEWIELLENQKLSAACPPEFDPVVVGCKVHKLSNKQIFDFFIKYGDYLSQSGWTNFKSSDLHGIDKEIKDIIRREIVQGAEYNEDISWLMKDRYPQYFLEEDAPSELKRLFYGTRTNHLTFSILKKHPEWLPFLENKSILWSLKKCGRYEFLESVEQFFQRYGDAQALKIGLKNPDSVTNMLNQSKAELLIQWYDKLHFIPHHIVMLEFPVEHSDKFLAAGRKWSKLMRIEQYNLNDESKSALLKLSTCFGVFDNDDDGYNKLIKLLTDIPEELSRTEMNLIEEKLEENLYIFEDDFDPEFFQILETGSTLIKDAYDQQEDENYTLKISAHEDQNTVYILRRVMEWCRISSVITPDVAHKLFGGFEVKYKPGFRDFLLNNINEILNSDDYCSYVGQIQRQWEKIVALNSNRILTLDLAVRFVKSNFFEKVQTGNEKLAETVQNAGYSQEDFEVLQEIYNCGKIRVFSSIPRIENVFNEYSYEITRLDDPLPVVIGKLTDCCQELDNAAETVMEHSMVDKHGRIFEIKDKLGNIVAQSWVWRNQNVLCFDNIEIPDKAFTRASREGIDEQEFADTIYEIYRRAANEMIEKDEIIYKKLLKMGKISKEEYESLKLAKVTVGLGYNDIAESLKRNAKKDKGEITTPLEFKPPIELSHGLYTSDSKTQYIIAGDANVPKSNVETFAVYADDFVIYDDSNMTEINREILQQLEYATNKDPDYLKTEVYDKKAIVSEIGDNYYLNPESTRIIMNVNFAIIYEESEEEIVIADILHNSLIEPFVFLQIRMAIEQLKVTGKKINTDDLEDNKKEIYMQIMNLDEEIDIERGFKRNKK